MMQCGYLVSDGLDDVIGTFQRQNKYFQQPYHIPKFQSIEDNIEKPCPVF